MPPFTVEELPVFMGGNPRKMVVGSKQVVVSTTNLTAHFMHFALLCSRFAQGWMS